MTRVNLKPVVKAVTKFAKKHAPKILAGVAIVSNGFGYYFMHKAAPKVHENLAKLPEQPKFFDKLKAFGPYWGALVMYIGGSVATIGVVKAGDKIAAGLTTLLSMSKAEAEQAKNKLLESVGPEKIQEMNDEAYQEAAKKNYPKNKSDIKCTGNGNVLFFEPKTGQWFRSSVAAVENAVVQTNTVVIDKCWADFNDWTDNLEIERSGFGDYFGWSLDARLVISLKPCDRYTDRELYYTICYLTSGEPTLYNGKEALPFRRCDDCYI